MYIYKKIEKLITKRRIIRQWYNEMNQSYQYRKKLIHGTAFYNIKQQKKSLYYWNNQSINKRRLTVLFTQIHEYRIKRVLKLCLIEWKEEAKISHLIGQISPLLDQYAIHLYPFKYFQIWKDKHTKSKLGESYVFLLIKTFLSDLRSIFFFAFFD